MATRMQQRRGTAAQWVSTNGGDGPILNAGEIGFESDTGKFKVGDGVNHWVDLEYFLNEAQIATDIEGAISDTEKGVANGVATLDSNAKLTSSQLPDIAQVTVHAVANEAARLALSVQPGDIAIQSDNGQTYVLSTTPASTNGNWTAITVSDPFPTHDTEDLTEGTTNKYFTDERAQDAIGNNLGEGLSYNDSTGTVSVNTSTILTTSNASSTYAPLASPALTGTPTAPTASPGTTTTQIATTQYVYDAINDIVDSAPGTLNTLNELAAALADNPNFATSVASDIAAKQDKVAGVSDTEIGYLDGVTSAIQTQIDGKSATGHTHTLVNITDVTATASELNILDGVTASTAELNILDGATLSTTELNYVDGVTSGIQSQIDGKAEAVHTHIISDITDITASAAELNILDGVTATTAELNILDGVTATTAEINTLDGITSSTAELNVLDGIEATTTELNYVHNVTSAIQTQLDSKASSTDLSNHEADTSTHGVSGAVVGTTDTQTLTNKTLTDPTITIPQTGFGIGWTGGSGSKKLFFPNYTGGSQFLVTETGSQSLSSKNLINPTVEGAITLNKDSLNGIDGAIVFEGATQDAYETTLTVSEPTDDRTITLPDASGTVALTSDLSSYLSLSGGTLTGNLILNANPVSDYGAATKAYVDSATAGLNVHEAVRVATTANVDLGTPIINGDLNNGNTIDGITLVTGDRVLVKNQTSKAYNGVYIVPSSGEAQRASDYNQVGEVDAGDFIFVQSGTTNGKTGWVQTNTITTVGTDDIEFTQFSGAGTYLAGTGLTLTGNTFSINTATTVDTSTAQTLTNKTLTSPVISTISNTGTVTLPTATDTLVGRATTDTLTNKTINGASNTLTVRLANDVTGTLPVANGGTGITSLGTGVATFLGTPSSANLASAVTDETGSGSLVFGTSPTIATPTFTGAVTLGQDPTTALHAATKQYVDKMSYATAASGSATYSVTTANANKLTEISHTSEVTVTVPSDASDTDYPIGTTMDFRQMGAGRLSFVWTSPATKVSTDGYTKSRTQYSVVTLEKRASNAWIIYGDIDA